MPKKKKLFLFRKIKRILEGFLKLGFCMESVPSSCRMRSFSIVEKVTAKKIRHHRLTVIEYWKCKETNKYIIIWLHFPYTVSRENTLPTLRDPPEFSNSNKFQYPFLNVIQSIMVFIKNFLCSNDIKVLITAFGIRKVFQKSNANPLINWPKKQNLDIIARCLSISVLGI